MPTPGPRTQTGPDPGYNNPDREQSHRFNRWDSPLPIMWPGRSAGLSIVSLRGNVLGAGQVRRLWRQAINLFPAQAGYSWTDMAPAPGRPFTAPGPVGITRALRYMTRSLYMGGGIDNTRYEGLHTIVPKYNRYKPVTVGAGQVRGRPTVRNRMTSFGSRVPPLNPPLPEAESGQ